MKKYKLLLFYGMSLLLCILNSCKNNDNLTSSEQPITEYHSALLHWLLNKSAPEMPCESAINIDNETKDNIEYIFSRGGTRTSLKNIVEKLGLKVITYDKEITGISHQCKYAIYLYSQAPKELHTPMTTIIAFDLERYWINKDGTATLDHGKGGVRHFNVQVIKRKGKFIIIPFPVIP